MGLPTYTTEKKKTACKPRTASAYGRAVKKQKVDYEPHRPTAARLKKKKTECRTLTAPAHGRAVNKIHLALFTASLRRLFPAFIPGI